MNVSICLLVYNHGHVLSETLDAILSQSKSDFELIISDDCSTDCSRDVIDRYKRSDTRIRALSTSRNLGMAGNANFAMAHAAGEFVALLHHDDLVSAVLLERWLEVAQLSPRISFVFNDYLIDGISSHRAQNLPFQKVMNGREFVRKVLIRSWGCPVRGTALIRRSSFEEIGGMDESCGLLADVDLWMRLALRGDVGYVSESLVTVRAIRPKDYPKEYLTFSWMRLKLLFDIHFRGAQRLCASEPPMRRWYILESVRYRINVEELKWLIYAVLKSRRELLSNLESAANSNEWYVTSALRRIIMTLSHASTAIGNEQEGPKDPH